MGSLPGSPEWFEELMISLGKEGVLPSYEARVALGILPDPTDVDAVVSFLSRGE
ncbi:hypothetical protein GCM10028801_30300 [Nocardioides maradonensis]